MKNADMPAMPCDEIVLRDERGNLYGSPVNSAGLTKREHFAALAIPPMEIIIEALKEHNSPFTLDDYIVYAVAYKMKEADLLLASLERKGD